MRIWVDADACPNPVKEILYRAADRKRVEVILVANQFLRTPPSAFVRSVQVASGFDIADNHIVKNLNAGDLVITADIPLAAEVIEAEGHAINPRGEAYTPSNIRQRLAMRDFMETMRSSGVVTDGPAAYSQSDRKAFADALDRFLARATKS